jgi:hypothetical protein
MSVSMDILRKATEKARACFPGQDLVFLERNSQTVFAEPDSKEFPPVVSYIGPKGADPNDPAQWMKFRWTA